MRKRTNRQIRKRRLAVAAIFALSVAVTAPLLAPSAGALVANPGAIDVEMNLTVATPNFTLAGMRSGLATATMQKNGVITIPKSGLTFDPVVVSIDMPQPATDPAAPPVMVPTNATVRAVAMSDFAGGLDPGSGAAFIVGDIQEIWTTPDTMTSCVVGPFRVTARTNAQGAHGYSPKTGTVSMVDPGFTLDAVPVSAPGCGGLEGAVNDALALPVTTTTTTTQPGATTTTTTIPPNAKPPVPSVVVALIFTPAPQPAEVPPPVEHPHQPQNPPPPSAPHPPTFTPLPNVIYVPTPGHQPSGSSHHQARRSQSSHRSSGNSGSSSSYDTSYRTKRRIGAGWSTLRPVRSAARLHPAPRHPSKATAKPRSQARTRPTQASAGTQTLNYTNAAFIKRPKSALAMSLDLVGLVGLLGFSSLALWLVTSELSEFSAVSRRLRTHRISGITK